MHKIFLFFLFINYFKNVIIYFFKVYLFILIYIIKKIIVK
jgi:hypothetical protein